MFSWLDCLSSPGSPCHGNFQARTVSDECLWLCDDVHIWYCWSLHRGSWKSWIGSCYRWMEILQGNIHRKWWSRIYKSCWCSKQKAGMCSAVDLSMKLDLALCLLVMFRQFIITLLSDDCVLFAIGVRAWHNVHFVHWGSCDRVHRHDDYASSYFFSTFNQSEFQCSYFECFKFIVHDPSLRCNIGCEDSVWDINICSHVEPISFRKAMWSQLETA